MTRPLTRRDALVMIGGIGMAALLAACGSGEDEAAAPAGNDNGADAGSPSASPGDESCTTFPVVYGGPFPGDGSNGPNVLNLADVVRSDIRSGIGDSTGTADGIPLTLELTIVDSANDCAPLEGAAAYVWHCDAEGRYSLYSEGATEQNYLRGVQIADAEGTLRFTSVFPGCYEGRWPHVHFEVYGDLDSALSSGGILATSQLAFDQATCEEAYADARYPGSAGNLAELSLESDNVFGDDDGAHQLATVTGNATEGYGASLAVPV